MNKPVLLITRPEPAGRRWREALPESLRARFHICLCPLIRIEGLGARPDLSGLGGVIFSSAHGPAQVSAPASLSKSALPAYCVGPATFAAARAAGWDAHLCGRNGAELIAALCKRPPPGPLLHLSGQHLAIDIAGALRAAGQAAARQVVYRQRALAPTPEARDLLGQRGPMVVPLFSKRSAQLLAHLVEPARPLYIVAISAAAAQVIERELPNAALRIARTPDSAGMVDATARLCHEVPGPIGQAPPEQGARGDAMMGPGGAKAYRCEGIDDGGRG